MLFKKFFIILIYMSIFFFILLLNYHSYYSFSFKYFPMSGMSVSNYDLNIYTDKIIMIFFFMVCVVTCLVSLYSELYMEHYNNKKFFFMMFLFFSFMSILMFSGSFILFFLGWDGLGLSSLCLIMFYPNKNTLYNSVMTMIFNRIGDVILIFLISKLLMNMSIIFFINSSFSFFMVLLFILCSFTKSAQFPLSSWLPAAMSAPTPISAMVHSSTLVTAGILIIQFLVSYMIFFSLNCFLTMISLSTFLIGGFLGFMEMDFKKIIAFSTMSQISMIMFFCSLNEIEIAMAHMLFHALFKTLLFVGAGLFFVSLFSKQFKDFMVTYNISPELFSMLLFLSVYSMSGLIFSSSFFSKDFILESFFSSETGFMIFTLLTGSVFTILYSSKLLVSITGFLNLNKVFSFKKMKILFPLIFALVMVYVGQFMNFLFSFDNFSFIHLSDLYFIYSIFGYFIYNNFSASFNKFFSWLMLNSSLEIFFMKFFSYSINSLPMAGENINRIYFNDDFMFKSSFLMKKSNLNLAFSKSSNLYGVLLLLIMYALTFM